MSKTTTFITVAPALAALIFGVACDREPGPVSTTDSLSSALSFADGCRMDHRDCVAEGVDRSSCGHDFTDCIEAARPWPPQVDWADRGLSSCALALELCVRGDVAEPEMCRATFVECIGDPPADPDDGAAAPPVTPPDAPPEAVAVCLGAWEICDADTMATPEDCQTLFRACITTAWGAPPSDRGAANR